MSDRHEELTRLFGELCDRDPEEQARALAEVGARSPELVRDLVELLDLDAQKLAGPLLDRFRGAATITRSVADGAGRDPEIAHTPVLDSDRYRIVRKIGEGGLGIVFEAEDRFRGETVALKTFRRPDSDAIFRLKREFRTLAGIEHPNLVTLFDLVVEDERAFFTMELVPGRDLLSHVRSDVETGALCDEDALRRVLPQLAQGIAALHAAGKLHRDIKPSNVKVTPEGRVVLLDFGLAVDVGELDPDSLLDAVAGTIAYMSPEQARAERDLGPTTDWYAFGVLAYEALTGSLPFSGRPIELMAKKTQRVAPPPRQLCPQVPADLDALCVGLLERDAAQRLRGAEVLEGLGAARSIVETRTDSSAPSGPQVKGREREIEALLSAFDSVQDRREARIVVVSGPSGIGKSSLVGEFLRRLRRRHGAVVLRGRCYESETVSFRAMDGVIDELSAHWRKLPDLEAGYLCPEEAHLLPVLFPVLGRVAAVAQRRSPSAPADRGERRDRAYAALRATFRTLAVDRPTVVFVDDMQWADAESALLLAELLRPPHMPPLLLILADRDHDQGARTPYATLLRQLEPLTTRLAVPPLSLTDSTAIARELVGSGAGDLAETIALEADGNAFFLTELCRASLSRSSTTEAPSTVDDLVRARVAALSGQERRVLELVSLAGGPVLEEVAETAAAQAAPTFAAALRTLRAASLVRTATARGGKAVESYHARVREAVVDSLPDAHAAGLHRDLAEALETVHSPAAEPLARHWHAAGDRIRAAGWAARAADDALDRLDFSRAAELFAMVLILGEHSDEERRHLLVRHGDALAESGRPAEAAEAFEKAIALTPNEDRLGLQRRVVQQLLTLGELDQGLDAAGDLTRAVGIRLSKGRLATLTRIAVGLIRLRLIGDDPRVRKGADAALLRSRFEVATALGRSLSLIDTHRGVECAQYAIRAASRLADPELRARMFSMRAMTAAARGDTRRSEKLLLLSEARALDADSPVAVSYARFGRGFHCVAAEHDWQGAIDNFEQAEAHWRNAGRGEGWELDSLILLKLSALMYQGEVRQLNEIIPAAISQYARSGRRVLEATLRARHGLQTVLCGAPEQAVADVDEALRDWPDKRESYLMQHMYRMLTALYAEHYRGRPAAAAQLFASEGKLLRRSLVLRVVAFRMEFEYVEGRTYLALARDEPESARRGLLRRAEKHARRLHKLALPMSTAYAGLLRAGASYVVGDQESSVAHLGEALARLIDMRSELHAACARRQLGILLGGDEGRAMVDEANLWMARQDIPDPGRATSMLLSGWELPDL